MYSFLSPQNVNYLISILRTQYTEVQYEEIRSTVPSLAHQWFTTRARINEDQFTGGTQALNEAFLQWIFATRQFMPPLDDPNPSYFGDITDPYIKNQPFQHASSNDIVYPSHYFDYDVGSAGYLNTVYAQMDESECGGVPLMGFLPKTSIAEIATEVKRRRDGRSGRRVLTDITKYCNDDFRTCEWPAKPRTRFTLPSYYETQDSNVSEFYWANVNPCFKNCPDKSSTQLRENVYNYNINRYPHKDIIPTKLKMRNSLFKH